MKPVQYFNDAYLERIAKSSPSQIADFLEDFINMRASPTPKSASKLISIRLPKDLLRKLKLRAGQEGLPYQTLIKRTLEESLR